MASRNGEGPVSSAWPYCVRAWALHGLGRDDEALSDLDRAVGLGGTSAVKALAMRGWLRWEADLLQEAEDDFDVVLTSDPQRAWCLVGRGVVRVYRQCHDDAVHDFAQAFAVQLGITDAKDRVAVPLVELLREYLPRNRGSVTAAIRLTALTSLQVRWPGLRAQASSVLAQRPSPRLLLASFILLRRTAAAVRQPSADEMGQRRYA